MDAAHPMTRALTQVIMHSTYPMVLTDPRLPDHPMIAVNAAFEALTGYGPAEAVGRNCRFLQGEGTDPKTPPRIRQCLDAGLGCIEWLVNYRRDGTRFWNLLFLLPVVSPDGTLINYLGNQRDITEGPPASLPDYSFGKASMPLSGQAEFSALLQGVLADQEEAEPARARSLEGIVEAARRLNEVTTRLSPGPWSPLR
jgi:PAS domain S-box-containing protein